MNNQTKIDAHNRLLAALKGILADNPSDEYIEALKNEFIEWSRIAEFALTQRRENPSK